jgi:hypothetical protein
MESLAADSPAHRTTRVAPDLIEKTVPGESETRSGSIPAGVSLRSVLRGNISGSKGQQSRKRPPVVYSAPTERQAEERACRLVPQAGGAIGSISEIPDYPPLVLFLPNRLMGK